jgi:hypothetical protein
VWGFCADDACAKLLRQLREQLIEGGRVKFSAQNVKFSAAHVPSVPHPQGNAPLRQRRKGTWRGRGRPPARRATHLERLRVALGRVPSEGPEKDPLGSANSCAWAPQIVVRSAAGSIGHPTKACASWGSSARGQRFPLQRFCQFGRVPTHRARVWVRHELRCQGQPFRRAIEDQSTAEGSCGGRGVRLYRVQLHIRPSAPSKEESAPLLHRPQRTSWTTTPPSARDARGRGYSLQHACHRERASLSPSRCVVALECSPTSRTISPWSSSRLEQEEVIGVSSKDGSTGRRRRTEQLHGTSTTDLLAIIAKLALMLP